MSDAGQASGEPGSPVTGAAALAGGAEAPPQDPPATSAPAAETPPQTTAGSWTEGLTPEQVGFVENKGWGGISDTLESYQNLEKMRGVPEDRLLTIPGDVDDADAWNALHAKLGRPETPDGYELEDAEWMAAKAHELGLNKQQAAGLLETMNAQREEALKVQNQEYEVESQNELAELRKELGSKFNESVATAQRAAAQLKLNADDLSAIEGAIGTKRFMQMFMTIGSSSAEAGFVSGASSSDGVAVTADGAKASVEALRGDPDFMTRYNSKDAQVSGPARKKLRALMQAAYPD